MFHRGDGYHVGDFETSCKKWDTKIIAQNKMVVGFDLIGQNISWDLANVMADDAHVPYVVMLSLANV